MVELIAPPTIKDIEGKFGVSFKGMIVRGSKTEVSDTDKLIVIKLEKKECISLVDVNNMIWELCRDKKGRYHIRPLLKRINEFER